MDPEDLREVISAYQKCVAETVRRFGGFVAKYMGDGVLVYFGYPQAHEDDAERAVRGGLELVAAVTSHVVRYMPTIAPLVQPWPCAPHLLFASFVSVTKQALEPHRAPARIPPGAWGRNRR